MQVVRNSFQGFSRITWREENLGDQGVEGRIKLKWFVKNLYVIRR
jgi:hypothetical protein